MDLATLDIDPNTAREKFLEYRRSVRERHSAEDEQIMRGYKALANGRSVIDIAATIRNGGTTFVYHRNQPIEVPRLAVARADARWCRVSRDTNGALTFYAKDTGWAPKTNESRYVVRTPKGTLPAIAMASCVRYNVRAMVPPVPPSLRPADNIANYHILWEAEWEAVAPRDPALLKHIGGDLYVVLSVWDLTELERTVLAGRFR